MAGGSSGRRRAKRARRLSSGPTGSSSKGATIERQIQEEVMVSIVIQNLVRLILLLWVIYLSLRRAGVDEIVFPAGPSAEDLSLQRGREDAKTIGTRVLVPKREGREPRRVRSYGSPSPRRWS